MWIRPRWGIGRVRADRKSPQYTAASEHFKMAAGVPPFWSRFGAFAGESGQPQEASSSEGNIGSWARTSTWERPQRMSFSGNHGISPSSRIQISACFTSPIWNNVGSPWSRGQVSDLLCSQAIVRLEIWPSHLSSGQTPLFILLSFCLIPLSLFFMFFWQKNGKGKSSKKQEYEA